MHHMSAVTHRPGKCSYLYLWSICITMIRIICKSVGLKHSLKPRRGISWYTTEDHDFLPPRIFQYLTLQQEIVMFHESPSQPVIQIWWMPFLCRPISSNFRWFSLWRLLCHVQKTALYSTSLLTPTFAPLSPAIISEH